MASPALPSKLCFFAQDKPRNKRCGKRRGGLAPPIGSWLGASSSFCFCLRREELIKQLRPPRVSFSSRAVGREKPQFCPKLINRKPPKTVLSTSSQGESSNHRTFEQGPLSQGHIRPHGVPVERPHGVSVVVSCLVEQRSIFGLATFKGYGVCSFLAGFRAGTPNIQFS